MRASKRLSHDHPKAGMGEDSPVKRVVKGAMRSLPGMGRFRGLHRDINSAGYKQMEAAFNTGGNPLDPHNLAGRTAPSVTTAQQRQMTSGLQSKIDSKTAASINTSMGSSGGGDEGKDPVWRGIEEEE